MRDQPRPLPRPAEVAHQLARQAERKVEAADPRARPGEERLELREALEMFHLQNRQQIPLEKTACHGDRLCPARGAGEIDAVDPHLSDLRRASSAADW